MNCTKQRDNSRKIHGAERLRSEQPSWEVKVQRLLDEHGEKRLNGKVASHKTRKATTEVLFNFFRTLHALGYKVQDPQNVGLRHVQVAVRHWWHDKKLAPKTLQSYLSRLRVVFETWLKKPGMVPSAAEILPDVDPNLLVVRTAAEKSKSWAEVGIPVLETLRKADRLNERIGMMLRMQLAFGLRRKEVLSCRPWTADLRGDLRVYPGEGKGNRCRNVPIETEVQRKVLNAVQARLKKREALGWEYMNDGSLASFEQQERRYNHYMERLGITGADAGATGHGLRAEYAENLALLEGFVPSTLGGTPNQIPAEELMVKKLQVSEALGHSRANITAAYYGTLSRRLDEVQPQHFKEAIMQVQPILLAQGDLPVPPVDVLDDCGKLVVEAMRGGASMTIQEVFTLWAVHSMRWGTEWIAPTTGVQACLEAAAKAVCRLSERDSDERQR